MCKVIVPSMLYVHLTLIFCIHYCILLLKIIILERKTDKVVSLSWLKKDTMYVLICEKVYTLYICVMIGTVSKCKAKIIKPYFFY